MPHNPMKLHETFIKPEYGSTCFAHLPATVKYLLTGQKQAVLPDHVFGRLPQRYNTVILFFIDAFGWRFFEKYAADYPFLQQLVGQGEVSKLTSQFPSTTAAHVTCIHTGLANGQSGVYEWQYYEPQLDALISPLLFSFAGTSERDTLKPSKISPKKLYPDQTIYQEMRSDGVKAYAFQPQAFARSTYSKIMLNGATIIPYRTLPEALVNLGGMLAEQTEPSYYFLYYPEIDSIGHRYGPESAQIEAEIDTFLTIMERLFRQKLAGKLDNTLFILTADHGMTETDPKTTRYLNRDRRLKGVLPYLRTDRRGQVLVPGGSARDPFLYIKPEALDEAHHFLAARLADQAAVYKTQDLIEAGLFGPLPVSPALLGRVGNLVILPYRYQSVWWYEKDRYEQSFYGHHGGLTAEEMEIPLLLYPF